LLKNQNLEDISAIDSVLISRAAEGDESAFRVIYDSIKGKMYSLCLRYASNAEEANDFFQDGCIKLYRNLGAYRNEGSFEGWARRVFVTCCLDALKKKKVAFAEINENFNVASDYTDAIDKMSMDRLMKIIQELPEGYKTIINLYVIENYSHKEIGDMLGISESGSKSKLHKARTYLKNLLPDSVVE
jgi:RNA polymerase sigma factor (sigma-70 family)